MQFLLIATGLLVAIAGIIMLVRMSRSPNAPVRPYIPIAVTAGGLLIAYRSYDHYRSMDAQDVLIMFVFVFALLLLLGLRFFIVDRSEQYMERMDSDQPEK